jgi:hypothetical protein
MEKVQKLPNLDYLLHNFLFIVQLFKKPTLPLELQRVRRRDKL